MRLAILSDIHGNYDDLNAVLEECKKYKIEQYLCLGDYVGYYYEPKKVWDLIYSLNGVKIKGNHEDLLNGSLSSRVIRNQIKEKYGTGHQVAQNQLSIEEIKQLYNLPKKKLIQIRKYTLYVLLRKEFDRPVKSAKKQSIFVSLGIAASDNIISIIDQLAKEYKFSVILSDNFSVNEMIDAIDKSLLTICGASVTLHEVWRRNKIALPVYQEQ